MKQLRTATCVPSRRGKGEGDRAREGEKEVVVSSEAAHTSTQNVRAHHVRVALLVEHLDVVELDVEEPGDGTRGGSARLGPGAAARQGPGARGSLVDTLELAADLQVVLELDGELLILERLEHREDELLAGVTTSAGRARDGWRAVRRTILAVWAGKEPSSWCGRGGTEANSPDERVQCWSPSVASLSLA